MMKLITYHGGQNFMIYLPNKDESHQTPQLSII